MAKKVIYKYFISPSCFGVTYWDENGGIDINTSITQKQLSYLYEKSLFGIFRKEI